jgi:[ribosomal protein S18]-alanine N-acetyltransferase
MKLQNGIDVIIRNASEKDLEQVQRIENSSFDDPYSKEFFIFLLHDSSFKVAVVGEEVAGYSIHKIRTKNALLGRLQPKRAILISLAIHSSWRRKGIASMLLDELIRDLKTSDAAVLELQVMKTNDSAKALYLKFGFKPTATIPNYYGRGRDAVVMEKSLL